MQSLGIPNLTIRLEQAAREATDPAAIFRALVALDPAGAVDWLLEGHDSAWGTVLAPEESGRVIDLLAETVAARPGTVDAARLEAVLRRHGDLLSPDRVLALVAGGGVAPVTEAAMLDRALRRAPHHPGILQAAAQHAAAAADGARAHELLTRLGRADPTLATVEHIRRTRRALPPVGPRGVRVAFLSSFTIQPLVPFVDLECHALGLGMDPYVGPFNAWAQDILDDTSGLHRFGPEIAFLAVALDDLIPDLAAAPAAADLERAGAAAVARLLAIAERFVSWSTATLVVHGLHSAFSDPGGVAAERDGPGRTEVIASLNARLAEGLRALPRAFPLDVPDVLLRRIRGTIDNPKMRHLARMRLGEQTLTELARAYARYVAPLKGLTRKCIVLDLDNTLWGGIVGEDGLDGIRLGETAPGSEFREFQLYLQALTQRGMLLAVNSKNNPDDALQVIRSHEAMVLREESFSAMRINWDPKPQNMLRLAEELSLGLDAFVFVDDSDKERALMRQALPQVLTPELSRDPALYRATLEQLPQLQTLAVTEEDRSRTRQYHERRQREQLRLSAETLDTYLESLEIRAVVQPASDQSLPRVHQLFQRTNQFNLTGRRYELGTLSARAHDANWLVYAARVRDRFGDHGLVASAVVQVAGSEWHVENVVMSCRVIGYGVEVALLAHVSADARRAGAAVLVGEFIPSSKNAPARDFYDRLQFERADDTNGVARWRRDVSVDAIPAPRWITLESGDGP